MVRGVLRRAVRGVVHRDGARVAVHSWDDPVTVWLDGVECCESCAHPIDVDCGDLCCAEGAETVSSDGNLIRGVLAENPDATAEDVEAALAAVNVTVSRSYLRRVITEWEDAPE